MTQREHWDPVTRADARTAGWRRPPRAASSTQHEQRTLGALLDVVLAQDAEPRIPVLAMVDAKLAAGRLDGYRYEDMPEDPETWRRVGGRPGRVRGA